MRAYEEGDYFGSHVCLDFETTNNQFGNPSYDNELVCVVWYFSDTDKWYYADKSYKLLLEHLWSAKVMIAHNAKFEIKWLMKELGAFLDGMQIFDPMLAQYTLDGVERHPLNLDALCSRYGLRNKDPIVDTLMKNGVCPSQIPRSMLKSRCLRDVQTTLQLYHILSNRLLSEGLMPMYHTKAEFCKVLSDIELNGMHLDKNQVRDTYIQKVNEFDKISQELDEFTGGINHNSPKQKQEYLYDVLGFREIKDRKGKPRRTSSGGRLTDADTLASLVAETEEQQQYLDLLSRYGKLNAELSKALEKFYECVESGELLYADFNQTVTRTHRLSSSGTKHKVQFQNLQREFKKLFSARTPGWGILEADGAQLEFRVAGFLGSDRAIDEAIRSGEDTHQYTSDKLTEAGQPTDRQGAKSHTFKPLYGGESGTPAEQAYYKAFKRRYAGIASKQEEWKAQVINNGEFSLPTGLVLRFPSRRVDRRTGYLNVQNSVVNYPVQYFATGEIIPIAMCFAHWRMRKAGLKSFIVNTVHDSGVVEYHPDELEKVKEIMELSFTHDVYNYLHDNYGIKFNIPLGVGIKAGEHWSEGEEIKKDVEPPYKIAA